MLVNTVDIRETSVRESSGHEEQHSRSFYEHLDGLRTGALAKKLGLCFLDMAGGTNVGTADGGTNVGTADGGTNEEDR